ncbi:MAG: hypothetical protein EBZ49_00565 [Proteobacteria bacterium]|nr:hypothetical protein [Pseudomonadota bacterium]
MLPIWVGWIGLLVSNKVQECFAPTEKKPEPIKESTEQKKETDAVETVFKEAVDSFLAKIAPNKGSAEHKYLKGLTDFLYKMRSEQAWLSLSIASEKFLDEVGVMSYHLPLVGQKICLAEAEKIIRILGVEPTKFAV